MNDLRFATDVGEDDLRLIGLSDGARRPRRSAKYVARSVPYATQVGARGTRAQLWRRRAILWARAVDSADYHSTSWSKDDTRLCLAVTACHHTCVFVVTVDIGGPERMLNAFSVGIAAVIANRDEEET